MNKGLSTVGCSDELSNLILAVKSIEHVEEKLGLIVPVDTVIWLCGSDFSSTEIWSELFHVKVWWPDIVANKKLLERQHYIALVALAILSLHYKIKGVKDDSPLFCFL